VVACSDPSESTAVYSASGSKTTCLLVKIKPFGWTINGATEIGNIPQGSSNLTNFNITRDDEDAIIYGVAVCGNAPATSTEMISIPILPIVIIGLIGAIILIGGYSIRKNKFK